jgi:hypothetical protein
VSSYTANLPLLDCPVICPPCRPRRQTGDLRHGTQGPFILDPDNRWRWVASSTLLSLYPRQNTHRYPINGRKVEPVVWTVWRTDPPKIEIEFLNRQDYSHHYISHSHIKAAEHFTLLCSCDEEITYYFLRGCQLRLSCEGQKIGWGCLR